MSSRALMETPDLRVGEFACVPGDPLWDEVNTNMGERPHVVFPHTHVLIAQEGARPVLATPNHVVFYRPHQLYRRALRDPRGDRCLWLEFSPALFDRPPPSEPTGPSLASTYLLAVGLARHLRAEPRPDRLLAEEAALRLLAQALGGDWASSDGGRPRTRASHAELAEAAKELLARRMAERLSLETVAAALYVSPFHLARVFRSHTGYSLAGYVHGLRLRCAAERIAAEPGVELSRLALELGYCSPSHFCDRFRAAFGGPPSALRGAQLSTIVEAPARAAT